MVRVPQPRRQRAGVGAPRRRRRRHPDRRPSESARPCRASSCTARGCSPTGAARLDQAERAAQRGGPVHVRRAGAAGVRARSTSSSTSRRVAEILAWMDDAPVHADRASCSRCARGSRRRSRSRRRRSASRRARRSRSRPRADDNVRVNRVEFRLGGQAAVVDTTRARTRLDPDGRARARRPDADRHRGRRHRPGHGGDADRRGRRRRERRRRRARREAHRGVRPQADRPPHRRLRSSGPRPRPADDRGGRADRRRELQISRGSCSRAAASVR